MIQSLCTYQLKVKGPLVEAAFNKESPLQVRVIRMDSGQTWIEAAADQSGLIGLLRLLHGQGFVLLRFERIECPMYTEEV